MHPDRQRLAETVASGSRTRAKHPRTEKTTHEPSSTAVKTEPKTSQQNGEANSGSNEVTSKSTNAQVHSVADTTRFEWAVAQARDTQALIAGTRPILTQLTLSSGKSLGRTKAELLQKMVMPCGIPPQKFE